MKKLLIAALVLAGFPVASVAVVNAAQTCSTSKVPVTHLVKVKEQVRVHGKVVTKTVEKREVVKVSEHVRVKVRVKVNGKWKIETKVVTKLVPRYRPVTKCIDTPTPNIVTTTTSLMTTSSTNNSPSTTTTTIAPAKTSVRGTTDPGVTLVTSTPQSPPVQVQFTYSADNPNGPLPDGTLTLNLLTHGTENSVAGCAANVGVDESPVGDGADPVTCTVSVHEWGQYDLQTIYTTNSPDVTPTEGFDTVDIEPPSPSPLMETWGTSSPTSGAAISATVSQSETSDAVTLTDPNFEGATSVTLTDNNGNACSATVSGTSASCTMDNTATPTSFTVSYPGGTTTTQTVTPWGIDQYQSVEWPADQVTISSPSVTTPSTTDVTTSISQIDGAASFANPCGPTANPGAFDCVEMGVEFGGTAPTGGIVTLTATAFNSSQSNNEQATCTVDLSSATTCFALFDSETGTVNLSSGQWTIDASYGGFNNGQYNATDWSSASLIDVTMNFQSNSGSWWSYEGS